MNHYCCFFSDAYFLKGVALYHSLLANESLPFKLWIMCTETRSYEQLTINRLANTSLITLSELEAFDTDLLACKTSRSEYEYYASCKASLMLYILKKNLTVDRLTYLDSDLYLFGNLGAYLATIANSSIALTPHRYKIPDDRCFDRGIYNAGWISIKSDETGLSCLEWWRTQVIEWCFNKIEDGKYADQKYLDHFAMKFSNFVSLDHIGINAAPWNIKGCNFKSLEGQIYIDDVPLLAYHFHGLINFSKNIFDAGTSNYTAIVTADLRRYIYMPYLKLLTELANKYPDFKEGIAKDRNKKGVYNTTYIYRYIHSLLQMAKRIIFKAYISVK